MRRRVHLLASFPLAPVILLPGERKAATLTWTIEDATFVVVDINQSGAWNSGTTAGSATGWFTIDYDAGVSALDWKFSVKDAPGWNEGSGWTGALPDYALTPSDSTFQFEDSAARYPAG
jgi:hypothetical protein